MKKYIVFIETTCDVTPYEENDKRFDNIEQAIKYGHTIATVDYAHGLTGSFNVVERTIDIEKFTCKEKIVYSYDQRRNNRQYY